MTQQTAPCAVTERVIGIIAEVLDISPHTITPETRVLRDLETESIDLLEFGVGLNAAFGIPVADDTVFLTSLRVHLEEARHADADPYKMMAGRYPHLSCDRVACILRTLDDGPVLSVQDIADYVLHALRAGLHEKAPSHAG
ncbi:acyl carrier protein [Oleidesulfovibrio alaskensis]